MSSINLENQIIHGDCVKELVKLPSESIDMVLTSPPYDDLREYGGCNFVFSNEICAQLYRVLKNGGVCVWIVGDKIQNGSESLSSFKQAIAFKESGFNVHDTMIYQKDAYSCPESNRYLQCFEYMFIFSKGTPKTFNPIHVTTKGYKPSKTSTKRYPDGTTIPLKYETGKKWRKENNVWVYGVGFNKSSKDLDAFKHPAIFPEELAKDHILTWSNKGDLILDPFLGSGTTAIIAQKLCRNYIGIEINKNYCTIAEKRLNKIPTRLDLLLTKECCV